MDRRTFVESLAGVAASISIPRPSLAAVAIKTASNDVPRLALPTDDQTAWQDMEMGMFIHFAPNTWQDREIDDLSTPLSAIDPKLLNTDQWASTAVTLGARYVVFVAKHAGGFCMWQTKTTKYSIGNTPWREGHGDVLADLSASCRRFGLKLGVYVSPRDDNFGAGIGGRCKDAVEQHAYNILYRRQLTEVLSRYGEMVEVWFDGAIVVPVADILERYAPHAMIFQGPRPTIRWVGNEDGIVPYPVWNSVSSAEYSIAKSGIATSLDGDPNGTVWLPIEVDVSILRPDWFWSAANQRNLLSLNALLDIYYRSVGRGAQLLLNIPPDTSGLIPAPDIERVRLFEEELRRRFSHAVAETRGQGSTIMLPIPSSSRIDTFILQEDCSLGQRVRSYRLEARHEGTWTTLGTGTSIGHKRIQPVTPTLVDAVRLIVTESAAPPEIRRLAVFDTQTPPPPAWNAPATAMAFDEVGSWKHFSFRINISNRIVAAAQYRMRFVPQGGWGGCADPIEHATLLLDGVPVPGLIQRVDGSKDMLILTLPNIGQQVVVEGRVKCVGSGTILLQSIR